MGGVMLGGTIGITDLYQALASSARAALFVPAGKSSTTTVLNLPTGQTVVASFYVGGLLRCIQGANANQEQTITANTTASITTAAFTTTPAAGDLYVVIPTQAAGPTPPVNVTQVGGTAVPTPGGVPSLPTIAEGSAIAQPTDRQATYQAALDSTTTALAASASYTGAWIDAADYQSLAATCYSDEDCTLWVEFSPDGTNEDAAESLAVTGGVVNQGLSALPRRSPYVRLVVVNGATAQGTLRAYLWGGA